MKKILIVIVAVAMVVAIAIGVSSVLKKDTVTVYTISFNTDGGTEVVSKQVEDGKTVAKPADPTKEGYEFLGWYLDGEYFDFKEKIEEDITLEAKWKEIVEEDNADDEIEDKEEEKDDEKSDEDVTKYTVKFDSDGGSKVASKTVEKNKTVKAPVDPTKDGYKFLGWYLGNTKYNFSNKVTKNIILKAKWEKVQEERPVEPEKPVEPEIKEYTVTFNTDGGSSVKAQTVKENETVSIPSNPTKDGYVFKGWYLNGAEYSFSSKVTKNITLTAKWEKEDVISYKIEKVSNSVMNQVRVYITLNGEKVAGTADVVNTQGETVKREIPASGWLTFDGTIKTLKNIKVK